MPFLRKENFVSSYDQIEKGRFDIVKFLRQDDRIYWEIGSMHKWMVAASGLDVPDDAGRILTPLRENDRFFAIRAVSTDLKLPKTLEDRLRTYQLLQDWMEGTGIKPDFREIKRVEDLSLDTIT